MEAVFSLLSLVTLPWWLAMLLFPTSSATTRWVTSPLPYFLLAGAYVVLLLAVLTSGEAPASLEAADLAAAMASPLGFLTAWTHMLALDLFAGTWLFRDAKYYGVTPRLSLVLTWWLGPVGLGWYLYRRRRLRGPADRIMN
jgi:hypothetical protein